MLLLPRPIKYLTNYHSEPLAGAMSRFDFMKHIVDVAKLRSASDS